VCSLSRYPTLEQNFFPRSEFCRWHANHVESLPVMIPREIRHRNRWAIAICYTVGLVQVFLISLFRLSLAGRRIKIGEAGFG